MEELTGYTVTLRDGTEIEVIARTRDHAIGEAYRTIKADKRVGMPGTVVDFRDALVEQCGKTNSNRGRKATLYGENGKKALQMYQDGIPIKEIAEHFNVTPAGIYHYLDKTGARRDKEIKQRTPSTWEVHMQDLSNRDRWLKSFANKAIKEGRIGNKKILYYDNRQVVLDCGNYRISHQWSDFYKGATN